MNAVRLISAFLRIGILHNKQVGIGRDIPVDEELLMNRLNVLAGNVNVLNQMLSFLKAAMIIIGQWEGQRL